MRKAFVEALCAAAAADQRIWLVAGDVGYQVLEPFIARYPQRFLNAGVAEQNMMGVATGLARAGAVVFVYSIVNFPVFRCLEQIRNDAAYHNADVKIVAVGGGLVYGGHGYTHHGVEDLGVMRLMPNMTVVAPADPAEASWATGAIAARPGPAYLRLGRGGEPRVHQGAREAWAIGNPILVRTGADLTIVTTGGVLPLALSCADALSGAGQTAAVFSVPTLAPLDAAPLWMSAKATGRLLVIEEHGRGGLGTILAEQLAERGDRVRFHSVHLRREPHCVAGTQDYLRGLHGLSPAGILAAARELLT